VRNTGTERHEILLLKLAPGKALQDYIQYRSGPPSGPAPAQPAGGVTDMSPGAEVNLSLDLAAGDYVFLCAVRGASGKRHYEDGMVAGVTIPGS